MLAFFLILVSAPSLALTLTDEEQRWLDTHPEIRVGETAHFQPLLIQRPDNSLQGILPDTFDILGRQLGVRFVFEADDWSRVLDRVKSRQLDIVGAMNHETAQGLGFHSVPSPINFSTLVFAHKNRNFVYDGDRSFKGLRVAYHRDKRHIQRYLEKHLDGGLPPLATDTTEQAFYALVSGQADVVVGMNLDSYHLTRNSILEVEPIHVLSGLDPNSVIALREDYGILAGILNKAVAEFPLKESERILSRWTWSQQAPMPRIQYNAEEKAYLAAHPVLRVQNLTTFPPFNYNDGGEPVGYSIDYMNLMGTLMGVRIEYVSHRPWHEYLEMLKTGELDVIPHIAVTDERREFIDFTPFNHVEYTSALAVRRGQQIARQEDLQNKVIAVAKKTFLHAYLANNYPNQALLLTASTSDAVKAVASGKADAVIGSLPALNYYIEKLWLSNVEVAEAEGFDLPVKTQLPMGVAKGNTLLKSILTKTAAAISYRQVSELKRKWMHADAGHAEQKDLNPQERAYLADKGRLTLCIDPSWMPLEALENGKHTGIAADFFTRFKRLIDLPMEVRATNSWQESLQAGRNGECDLFPLIMDTPQRRSFLSFTQPYLQTPLVLTTAVEAPFISDISGLKGKTVGVVKDYAFGGSLQRRFPELKFIEVKDIADGLQRVANGTLFGYADSLVSAGYWIQDNYIGQLKVSAEFEETWALSVGVRKGDQLLRAIFDKAINQLTPDDHHDIVNHWISFKYQKGIDWRMTLASLLSVVILFSAILVWYGRINRKLREEVQLRQRAENQALLLANTDQLTGLLNRHASESLLNQEMARRRRANSPVCILLLDIDHFKSVNDHFGHRVGDEVLKLLSQRLVPLMRETDHLVRWGGEEFLILASDTPLERAVHLAEKLRRAVEAIHTDELPRFTVSIGVAEFELGQNFNQWYETADKALYQAKASGRNRVHPDRAEVDLRVQNPMRLQWKNEYSSGSDAVDGQHQHLFEEANRMIELMVEGADKAQVTTQIGQLLEFIEEHFRDEERLLEEVGYPEANTHANEHQVLIRRGYELLSDFNRGLIDNNRIIYYLTQEVITNHLLISDARFFAWVR
ncbi:transporter substrate-binding domain-containing protein [Motiliproteus coralliicola]|uniref:transporter substrate-binding domain-containing protein n=1 Tax=Motiliproteus coralliicola TaxID=2283196 RepID=UPI00140381AB|nr:transporter substrate-binding domain-containing protein [Motiliproteus coralliicola]